MAVEPVTRERFITLEGGEGAGKSTQARRLASKLEEKGHSVVVTREPGGSPGAEIIRKLIVSGDAGRWTPKAEALLVSAAREDHLMRTIRPALDRGAWVVCDRFIDSTRAYQGAAQGLNRQLIDTLGEMVIGEDMPGLTLMLDLPVEAGLARAGKRAGEGAAEDRYEKMETQFHQTLRQAFLDIAAAEPGRCAVVDAARNEDEVAASIWAEVGTRLAI
ncbi:dTMP kinase [Parvibaculum sp.]|uniref:dTMP kinase n=1 Tax=Parvibaculum sp. TaxID=2024848 RepID=UPI003BA85373